MGNLMAFHHSTLLFASGEVGESVVARTQRRLRQACANTEPQPVFQFVIPLNTLRELPISCLMLFFHPTLSRLGELRVRPVGGIRG